VQTLRVNSVASVMVTCLALSIGLPAATRHAYRVLVVLAARRSAPHRTPHRRAWARADSLPRGAKYGELMGEHARYAAGTYGG
jgi:hypothetical protein